MKLIYINHSGFALVGQKITIIIDYFKGFSDSEIGENLKKMLLESPNKIYVLSSHFHPDHFNPEVLTWKRLRSNIHYIFSKDILKRRRAKVEDAIYIRKGEEYNDENIFIRAYGSTDVGISFYIETEGKKIFHAGDLNNWHWADESTVEEAKEAENHYLRELNNIAIDVKSVDVAMFPVDARIGNGYMRGAEQFVNHIQVGIFVPMHFWEHFSEAQAFALYANAHGCRFDALHIMGETIEF